MKALLEKILSYSPKANINLVEKAYYFAEKAHRGQIRESGGDYITHLLKTAHYLADMKLSSVTIAAGLLHDVVDDTPVTNDDIKKEFGKEVAFLVEGVSKLGKIKYRGVKRHVENLRKLLLATAKDIRVILIKFCDRIHNLETLNYVRPDKQKRIALESLEIYAPLAYRLGIGELKGKIEDLSFPYAYPQEYKDLTARVKDKYEERQKFLEKVKPLITKKLRKEGIYPIEIHYRTKHYYSLWQKLQRYDNDLNKIYDLVALRIIVKNIEECYKALGIVHKLWKPLPGRIKDYIALPKPNGYQSLHTTVICINGRIIEFQIRTQQMHKEAELGIAAHWYYSEQKGIKDFIKKKIIKAPEKEIDWIKQLKDWQKATKDFSPDKYLESLKIDFFQNRIFVFTPKGDVLSLPEKATPVDFAYAIHTDVGNHCHQAKVNQKIARLDQPLNNGDIVEIITNKNRKPSKDWFRFIKGSLTRSRIKKFFRIELEAWRKTEGLNKKEAKKEVKDHKENPVAVFSPKTDGKKKTKILVGGHKGISVNLAKCCAPVFGDSIEAHITRNNGASIHRADCKNLKQVQKKWPQKIIEATWTKE
ncbi:MAG: RelA/SpoT family protein [bacterium]